MAVLRRRRPARGFTILEILIAVVITAIGFAAIFALQIGVVQGNSTNRDITGAVSVGERFVETLRRAGHTWTSGNPPAPLNAPVGWHTLTPQPVDHNGLPIAGNGLRGSNLRRQRYCVHYWVEPMATIYDGILNARVRVVWPRATLDDGVDLTAVCTEVGAANFDGDIDQWFTLTLPATVRRHPPGGGA
jgi:prepilin-type N-terminal cleavage/methylation domain-containing protein